MKFNKQELRKAAEKATKGNYVVGHCDINKHGNLSSVYVCQEWNGMAGGVVAECHVNCLTKNSDQVYANAGFMALACPANVISLLEEISTLESRCAALAAENAGLKKFCKDAAFDADYEAELGMERGGFTDALNNIKTPATDAFLAEVLAQGVEMFAIELNNLHKQTNQGSYNDYAIKSAVTWATDFAAQLRKGVQS